VDGLLVGTTGCHGVVFVCASLALFMVLLIDALLATLV
jgi:hypothetical protein